MQVIADAFKVGAGSAITFTKIKIVVVVSPRAETVLDIRQTAQHVTLILLIRIYLKTDV